MACPPCLRKLACPPAPKPSLRGRLQQVLAGLTALILLMALLFVLLQWRTNAPEQHLDFGHAAQSQLPGQGYE
jgi:hypothetical protein